MSDRASQLMRLGYLWGAILVFAVLYWQAGPVAIGYGFALLIAYGVISMCWTFLRPRPGALNDPVYKQNVQRWVDRAAQSEGKAE